MAKQKTYSVRNVATGWVELAGLRKAVAEAEAQRLNDEAERHKIRHEGEPVRFEAFPGGPGELHVVDADG